MTKEISVARQSFRDERMDVGDFINVLAKLNKDEKVKFYYLLKGISFFLEKF